MRVLVTVKSLVLMDSLRLRQQFPVGLWERDYWAVELRQHWSQLQTSAAGFWRLRMTG